MKIGILDHEIRLAHLRTRMPFRYGIATMTHVPLAFVALDIAVDGRRVRGISSDCLPPKWFTKIPDKPLEKEIEEMLEVIGQALELAKGRQGDSVFDLWQGIYRGQADWGRERKLPPLLVNFGVSLVERALMEAVNRAAEQSLAEAIRSNLWEIDLGAIHEKLAGAVPEQFMASPPLPHVQARHTIGLADPLRDADIPEGERLRDGLPQSLEACIGAYGLRHFKIKVNGNPDQDLPRLQALAEVFRERVPEGLAFSIDGNEQFRSMADFREFWESVIRRTRLDELFAGLMFVEQPLHRDAALAADVKAVLKDWPDRPPLIIDESDGSLEDLPRALELGYAGTSHKNCKGIIKGLANACLLKHRQREHPDQTFLLSGEDLCNIGPVALLQDLAVQAALGIESVERNGHHYHAGLSQLPKPVQNEIMRHHGDLYRRSEAGWPTLKIEQGRIDLDSVNQAPFGVGFQLDLAPFEKP